MTAPSESIRELARRLVAMEAPGAARTTRCASTRSCGLRWLGLRGRTVLSPWRDGRSCWRGLNSPALNGVRLSASGVLEGFDTIEDKARGRAAQTIVAYLLGVLVVFIEAFDHAPGARCLARGDGP